MRAYFFGNMYLSSLQQGLQSTHVLGEMVTKYHGTVNNDEIKFNILLNWGENHKTIIILNAGYSENIHNLIDFFNNTQNEYPWASFNEGKDALDGALTCAGIIIPEKIYETASIIRHENDNTILNNIESTGYLSVENDTGLISYEINKWEFELIKKLNTFGMAR